ncbi:hypothetical protein NDU88_000538 [Pleurodeles waltl]|uniref:Uncharacterized protein n=1 Tax=Pleurodeles waltl TaxID=8319 RepID=A0AAV7TFA1_PLEWA|nr:hypothetical protein NDU88_000538 [Pleurodeles waltl]
MALLAEGSIRRHAIPAFPPVNPFVCSKSADGIELRSWEVSQFSSNCRLARSQKAALRASPSPDGIRHRMTAGEPLPHGLGGR